METLGISTVVQVEVVVPGTKTDKGTRGRYTQLEIHDSINNKWEKAGSVSEVLIQAEVQYMV
jgi:hypothetical protein